MYQRGVSAINHHKILVIDDEDAYRKMLKKALDQGGYQVLEAEGGRVGLRMYREFKPDLVITDLVMPDMEGIETIKALKALNPNVKIIAISGGGLNNPEIYLRLAKLMGAGHVFSKPLDIKELLSVISRMVFNN